MKDKSFKIDRSIYLDFNKPLSYNALLTFIITERGLGKSYGAKKFVAKRFINKGKQFVYLRRYKTELKQAMMKNSNPLFFKQIENDEELKDHKFTNKNDTMYIDDKLCGFAMPLSIANILKSSTYDNVDTIIFDEFLIDKGNYHYLQNEVIQLLDVIETVARLRDIRVIFLGNAISITNPYFTFFNLSLPYNSEVKIAKRDNKGNPLIVIYYAKNQAYREVKKQSRFGQLIDGTEYGKYAIDNEFLRDSKSFIKKKTKNCKFYFILVINNKYYGVWCDFNDGNIYINQQINKEYGYCYSLGKNHKENMILAKTWRKDQRLNLIVRSYRDGCVYYNSQETKRIISYILSKY